MADVAARRWRGNGYLPGRLGWWGVNGLAVVEIAGARVTVRLSPGFLARLLGVAPLAAKPGNGLAVTFRRVRLGWGWFIDFQLPGGQTYSFITTAARRDEILSCLSAAGFDLPPQAAV